VHPLPATVYGRPVIVRLWRRLCDIGLEGLSLEERRKSRALNQFIFIAATSLLSYAGLVLVLVPHLTQVVVLDVVVASLHLTGYWHVRAGRRVFAVAQFLLLCNLHGAGVAYLAGPAFGFHYYSLAFVVVVFLVSPRKQWFHYPWALVAMASFLYFSGQPVTETSDVARGFALTTIVATCFTLGLVAFLFDHDARVAEADLEKEHARSEELLLNVLPASISKRLKDGQQSIADGFGDVSVVFADLVGFTELSQRLEPDELVRVLNEVFSSFDELAETLGVEKIKTIGDAYMAAVGLPEPNDEHAVVATRMALGMRDAIERLNETRGFSLGVRIGVNSGPVVAGVIGKKKFIYDLWGDTVNTASRMESHGVAGTVHVSESTAKRVEHAFELEARGPIQVKGKGEMNTYLVRGPIAS